MLCTLMNTFQVFLIGSYVFIDMQGQGQTLPEQIPS